MREDQIQQRLALLDKLAKVLQRTHLTAVEYEANGVRVVLRRSGAADQEKRHRATHLASSGRLPPASAPLVSGAIPQAENVTDRKTVHAGMAGIFFRGSSPGADPYVTHGSRVAVGQTLCIIEAMKMLNEVECEWPGQVAEILQEDGATVSTGDPLFVIEVSTNV